jgi:toxin-antitoxin system PIN domain toxin
MSRVALLDVNVLLALFDADHVHHEIAHDWFSDHRTAGWSTCPLTENDLVRILSSPAYSPVAERPALTRDRLRKFCQSGHHFFWDDNLSLCDARIFPSALPVASQQVTDVYLLALARHHDGCLATFDRRIPLKAVSGATTDHLAVIER